jgi:hypothetical protein
MTTATHEPNLAQLFFGHQGRLGWVQTLWLRRPCAALNTQFIEQKVMQDGEQDIEQDRPSKHTFEVTMPVQADLARATAPQLATDLDHELKHLLDPTGLFG